MMNSYNEIQKEKEIKLETIKSKMKNILDLIENATKPKLQGVFSLAEMANSTLSNIQLKTCISELDVLHENILNIINNVHVITINGIETELPDNFEE